MTAAAALRQVVGGNTRLESGDADAYARPDPTVHFVGPTRNARAGPEASVASYEASAYASTNWLW